MNEMNVIKIPKMTTVTTKGSDSHGLLLS